MTTKGHCESSLGSFDECSAAHKRLSTLRPSHLTWAVSPPVGSYRLQPPSPFIIITQPESWYSFTIPRRVEGWVDLGTVGKVHTACAQGCKSQWLCDKHNCPQRDSIPGPRALQSDMLPLDHCDLQWWPPFPHVTVLNAVAIGQTVRAYLRRSAGKMSNGPMHRLLSFKVIEPTRVDRLPMTIVVYSNHRPVSYSFRDKRRFRSSFAFFSTPCI